jgi:hypothetical protein
VQRYFFHIEEDGVLVSDDEGQELAQEAAARKQAIETAAAIANDAFVTGLASRIYAR